MKWLTHGSLHVHTKPKTWSAAVKQESQLTAAERMADDTDFSLDAAESAVSGVEVLVKFPNENVPQRRTVPVETGPDANGDNGGLPLTVAQSEQKNWPPKKLGLCEENGLVGKEL
ncbi:uncharacterized protein LOC101857291 isoform X2 [Aplysia californica]|uniref:Uncharacterized protein LOC101857291 isoform X2 n=2 Tax=Aplysia californica TaxID=6500 RepID=A0ABM1W2W1_APLCA|nr:uncharacterized protein LOC101857291 isoform X2 [Aplysia californica]